MADAAWRCDDSSSDSEDDAEEDNGRGKRRNRLRSRSKDSIQGKKKKTLGLWLCGAATVAVLVGLALWIPKLQGATAPTWEVKELVMERLNIPALAIQGMAPADTTECPMLDPCGVASSRGCSVCPDPKMWNDGCVCREKDPGSNASASPGTVVQANVSNCPIYDKCGILMARGCSKCPDDTWTNDGCTCRQALSADQLIDHANGIVDGLAETIAPTMSGGEMPTTIEMEMRVTVEVSNPNPIGATTSPGVFKIRYRGTEIGSADSDPATVPARGSVQLVIYVAVDSVPPDMGMMMLQEILQTGSQLALVVDGDVTAKVNVLKVKCSAECKLRTDVSKLPKVSFSENKCTYGYSL